MWSFELPGGRTVRGEVVTVQASQGCRSARFIHVYNTHKQAWTTTLIHLNCPANIPCFMGPCTPPDNKTPNTSVEGYATMIERAKAHVSEGF